MFGLMLWDPAHRCHLLRSSQKEKDVLLMLISRPARVQILQRRPPAGLDDLNPWQRRPSWRNTVAYIVVFLCTLSNLKAWDIMLSYRLDVFRCCDPSATKVLQISSCDAEKCFKHTLQMLCFGQTKHIHFLSSLLPHPDPYPNLNPYHTSTYPSS